MTHNETESFYLLKKLGLYRKRFHKTLMFSPGNSVTHLRKCHHQSSVALSKHRGQTTFWFVLRSQHNPNTKNPDKDTAKKESYRPMSLMSVYTHRMQKYVRKKNIT